jgi:hypothetical protein
MQLKLLNSISEIVVYNLYARLNFHQPVVKTKS